MEHRDKVRQAAIDYVSRQIDVWNRTAVTKKAITTLWRKRTFILILLGTFFGLLSQEIPIIESQLENGVAETYLFRWFDLGVAEQESLIRVLHQFFAAFSALAIALASYAGSQILTSDLEKEQIKARATCESLKVQAFLYIMHAPPYSGTRAEEHLYERVELILKEVRDVIPIIAEKTPKISMGKRIARVISFGLYKPKVKVPWVQEFDIHMTFEQYFHDRVDDQINGYYLKKAAEFQKTVNKGNSYTVILGFIGVVLGTVAASNEGGLSMWIAFLSTASASIASYLHANKFEYLMISYVSTANKLELLSAKHQNIAANDLTAQRKLVAETETIFAMEHNAWISEIAGSVDDESNEESSPIFNESVLLSKQSEVG